MYYFNKGGGIKMFSVDKYVCIVTLCFLTAFLATQCSVSKEELKKTSTYQQKPGKDQKQAPDFTLKGTKIETVSDRKSVPAENQPRISFDSISYDAGEVWEGDVVSHTFTVKNTGTAQLNIAKVKPG